MIVSTAKVVNCKVDEYDVYIGRPSKWGNPWPMSSEEERLDVIAMYEYWLETSAVGQKIAKDARAELAGKRLGCFCSPKPCHGDVLAAIANG